MCGNRAEAEDLTQQTFFKIFRAEEKKQSLPQEEAEMKFFLYRVARNTFFDKFRFFKRLRRFQKSESVKEQVQVDDSLKLILRQLIEALPQRQREVFILRHWHGFSTREAAKMLNINEGSVKSHLSRAIEKLKAELLTTDLEH